MTVITLDREYDLIDFFELNQMFFILILRNVKNTIIIFIVKGI